MATRPVREQVQLLLLDPVLHLAPLAVHVLVELLRVARHVGHHEPRVGALRGVLGLDDHPPGTVPGPGRVGERVEDPLRLTGPAELPLGLAVASAARRSSAGLPARPST